MGALGEVGGDVEEDGYFEANSNSIVYIYDDGEKKD